jgi:hypothetical protein
MATLSSGYLTHILLLRVHDWRNGVVTVGEVPREMVAEASNGHLDKPWPAQVNKLVWGGGHDLILSIGQVVPHEVYTALVSTLLYCLLDKLCNMRFSCSVS